MGNVSTAPVLVVVGMDFEARIAAAPGVEVVYGRRAAVLEDALAARLRAAPCAGVISFGVAGGLVASLVPGDVVVADCVVDGSRRFATDLAWRSALRQVLPGAHVGAVAANDEPAASVADKAALQRASGALAVDMESHRAARAAAAAGVPFVACRVVIDPALRAVPSAAVAGMGSDGRTDLVALLRVLARHPGQLPDLLRLARDSGKARAALRTARTAVGDRYSLPN